MLLGLSKNDVAYVRNSKNRLTFGGSKTHIFKTPNNISQNPKQIQIKIQFQVTQRHCSHRRFITTPAIALPYSLCPKNVINKEKVTNLQMNTQKIQLDVVKYQNLTKIQEENQSKVTIFGIATTLERRNSHQVYNAEFTFIPNYIPKTYTKKQGTWDYHLLGSDEFEHRVAGKREILEEEEKKRGTQRLEDAVF